MTARELVAIALAAATVVAACGDDSENSLTNGRGNTKRSQPADTDNDGVPDGEIVTLSPSGKDFYKKNVHPFLSTGCGGCHGTAGPGPSWLTANDSEKSYFQLFSQGYVIRQSRITMKPAHGGISSNRLNAEQILTYNQWVEMELKDGGEQAAPNILEKLGSCFDATKFEEIEMGEWRTITRNDDNNTNNITPWNENANTCTGCAQIECSACHSADDATNYFNAENNAIFPPNTTFDRSKLTTPAFITKYFGVSPDGKPIASNGIKKKSDSTKKDTAYSHPLYELNPTQQQKLDAFVNDVLAKYSAGTCGK